MLFGVVFPTIFIGIAKSELKLSLEEAVIIFEDNIKFFFTILLVVLNNLERFICKIHNTKSLGV
jgi:hypothetical protein